MSRTALPVKTQKILQRSLFYTSFKEFWCSCGSFEGFYIFPAVRRTSVFYQRLNFPQLLSYYLKTALATKSSRFPSLSLCNVCELPYVAMGNGWHWTGVCRHCGPSGGQRCLKTKVHFLIYKTTCFSENPGAFASVGSLFFSLCLFFFGGNVIV